MTVPSNTFQTYQAIGNREDLSDVIYRIDPTDTPCMTAFEREKASAVNHEWQTQALAAVDTTNAVVEGDDATSDAATPSVRLGNLCQISDKVARVSGTQRAVEHAGRDDELEYQETLKGLELKRDMESILVGTNQAKAAGDGPLSRARQPRSSPGSGPTPTRAPPAAQPILRRRMVPAPVPTAPSAPSPRRS
jgi:hypothetical protein